MSQKQQGFVAVLEGYEGAGKSTQVERLKEIFEARGHEVITLREPGGDEVNDRIRDILKEFGPTLPIESVVCLLLAAKRNLLVNAIFPALQRNAIVLIDRYTPSLYAYQSNMGSMPTWVLDQLITHTGTDYQPELYFYLTAPKEVLLERVYGRNGDAVGSDKFEDAALEKADAIIEGYEQYFRELALKHDHIYRIPVNQSVEEVTQTLLSHIDHIFPYSESEE